MEMKEYTRLVIFTCVVSALLVVGFANIFSDLPTAERTNILFVKRVDSYPMNAIAVNTSQKFKMGVVPDPDRIDFGIVTVGGQVRKRIVLMNPSQYPAKAKFFVFGNISNHVHVGWWNAGWDEHWSVIIPPKSTKSVEIGFEASEIGNFTGVMKIVTFMPITNPWFLINYI